MSMGNRRGGGMDKRSGMLMEQVEYSLYLKPIDSHQFWIGTDDVWLAETRD